MAYSTKEEVRQLLQGVVEGGGIPVDYTPNTLSDAQIEYEIKNADEQINATLRRKYSIPLAEPVPAILNTLSVDIAAALCDMTWRGSKEYTNEYNPFRLRYDRALLILDRIAEGSYPIYNPGEGPNDPDSGAIVINPYDGDVLLTEDVFPRGYRPGPEHQGEFVENIPYKYTRSWY
jgi:phage gp36-like protein